MTLAQLLAKLAMFGSCIGTFWYAKVVRDPMEVQYRALSMVLLAPSWPHLSNFGLVSGQIGHVWETLRHFLVSQRGHRGSVSAVNQFYIEPNSYD